jgi:hypothetical protein
MPAGGIELIKTGNVIISHIVMSGYLLSQVWK